MNTKLILVEGLPGFGKSTTAKLIYELMIEKNKDVEIFLEGNLDHPADYDGVAFFTKSEINDLILKHINHSELIKTNLIENELGYLIAYQKLNNQLSEGLPEKLYHSLAANDIYELPLKQNKVLIQNRWNEFSKNAQKTNKIYIFECCFIQNPITVGMVKYNAGIDVVIDYIKSLENAIEKLNPILIYVNQDNLAYSFNKAINERSKQWIEGFIHYYSSQAFGKENQYSGLEGTMKILQERKKLEQQVIHQLSIKKEIVNNSKYDLESYKQTLANLLNTYIN